MSMDDPSPRRGGGSRVLADVGLASLSGLLLVASFPRFDLNWLAWGALVPLLVVVGRRRPYQAYLLASVTGLVFFVGVFEWIWQVPAYNLLDEALLGLFLSQFIALWAAALSGLRRSTGLPSALLAPPLWVALEYARGHVGFLSLPWMLLGHSQYRWVPVIQLASITGVYGLSFLIVLCNVGLGDLLRRARGGSFAVPASAVVAAAALGAVLLHGGVVLWSAPAMDVVTVAGVQGNIPQNVKWDRAFRERTLERYSALTREAVRRRPALVVWPETAVPGDVEHDEALLRPVRALAAETGTPLLVGSAEAAKFRRRELGARSYNSMVMLSPEGRIVEVYRKLRLVPFGEYEPLKGVVTWPEAVASSMGNSVPGETATVFTLGPHTVAATICWENIFPELVSEFVRRGARLIVNATNEAWFQDTGAPHQFLAISVFRAAENRVAVLRVANTGISAVIDPFGRITRRLGDETGRELFVSGILVADMPVSRTTTAYTVFGDVFVAGCFAACAAFAAAALARRLRPATGARTAVPGAERPAT
jgi:apolipoprotein N-acyltransferase